MRSIFQRIESASGIEELPRPLGDFRLMVAACHGASQIRQLGIEIGERIGARRVVQRIVRRGRHEMVELHIAFEAQLGRSAVEAGNGDRIALHVVKPPDHGRLRTDRQRRVDQAQIVAVPGPDHQAMVAQPHWIGVAVCCQVADIQAGHEAGRGNGTMFGRFPSAALTRANPSQVRARFDDRQQFFNDATEQRGQPGIRRTAQVRGMATGR